MISADSLLRGVTTTATGGGLGEAASAGPRVDRVIHDSRAAGPGAAFVAIRGEHHDGHAYVDGVAAAGAELLVLEEAPKEGSPGAQRPWVVVPDTRAALAILARNFFDDPTSEMRVVGITGTNGKTTSAFLTEAGLQACGHTTGLLGTVRWRWPGVDQEASMTTPDALQLQGLFDRMRSADVSAAVIEVSSHAIVQHRVDAVDFSVAAFTNLSQDHLDYHGTMEEYLAAKELLFTRLLPASPNVCGAAINIDDPVGAELAARTPGRVLRFSARGAKGAELAARDVSVGLDGISALLETPDERAELRSPLVGWHNLENMLTAIACGLLLAEPLDRLAIGVGAVAGVPGRLEGVPNDLGISVLVDYAHTPDALSRVLAAIRPLTTGRIITVFGCGGDRDRQKRPLMGQAAAAGSDVVLVSSDNPRNENPAQIVRDAVEGIEAAGFPELTEGGTVGYRAVVDRREAIFAAVALAEPGDAVLVAGKGHEPYQEAGGVRVAFSDVAVARQALEQRGGGAAA